MDAHENWLIPLTSNRPISPDGTNERAYSRSSSTPENRGIVTVDGSGAVPEEEPALPAPGEDAGEFDGEVNFTGVVGGDKKNGEDGDDAAESGALLGGEMTLLTAQSRST